MEYGVISMQTKPESHNEASNTMAIKFSFKWEEPVLHVNASGKDDDLEDVLRYSTSVIEQALLLHTHKILCDERNLEYTLSTLDTYDLAEYASQAFTMGARIAIVCKPDGLKDGKFYETVASNRGLIVFVTSDIEQAKSWLMK